VDEFVTSRLLVNQLTRSVCPLSLAARAFLAFKMGKGQFKPRVSSSLSNVIQIPSDLTQF
jgi:hypothetical protein